MPESGFLLLIHPDLRLNSTFSAFKTQYLSVSPKAFCNVIGRLFNGIVVPNQPDRIFSVSLKKAQLLGKVCLKSQEKPWLLSAMS